VPLSNSVWSGFEFIAPAAVASTTAAAAASSSAGNSYGYKVKRAGKEITFTVTVNNTTPLWFYCAQGKHCQTGMSMVVNVAAGVFPKLKMS
jgi:hypothetical protein